MCSAKRAWLPRDCDKAIAEEEERGLAEQKRSAGPPKAHVRLTGAGHRRAFQLVVLVPTKNRANQLGEAVSSAIRQTLQPGLIVVVGEKESDLRVLRESNSFLGAQLLLVLNHRTPNLSGAVNSGVLAILDQGFVPELTFIALLDDDDAWEPRYLERCARLARSGRIDWVLSGIIRHEAETAVGARLAIPQNLTMSTFFRTNPHVQGSNLFVRLSTLLKAGCFDENLLSTTDRDICVRLLGLGNTRLGYLHEYHVHHRAWGSDRLSALGSLRKREGLRAFYAKYEPLMTESDKSAFIRRAHSLFGIAPGDFNAGMQD